MPQSADDLWSIVPSPRERGRTLASLAQEWECDASHASHVVAELVENNYAVRPRDPKDGRRRLVTLTDAGVAIKQQIIASP